MRTPEEIKSQVRELVKALIKTGVPRNLVGFLVTPEEASEVYDSLLERSTVYGDITLPPKHIRLFGILLFSDGVALR